MSQTSTGLEKLEVWQKAVGFAVRICKEIIPLLPAEEKWALAQQIRRSVQSIPANIAEGYGRFHYLDNVRFCYIARGSLEETFSHLVIAHRLGYISDSLATELSNEVMRLRQMINAYISFLKRRRVGEDEFPRQSTELREEFNEYIAERDLEDELPNNELTNNELSINEVD